ncbi:MAG TPA: fructose 1,6-bisphosphatase [Methanocorpusculum sp.]|nr:fructose 1,6-bisphosphatase [Methanocorpusculum sp.]
MTVVAVYSKPFGGIAGRVRVFPDILASVDKALRKEKGTTLTDYVVTHIGDRVIVLLTYKEEMEEAAANVLWSVFVEAEAIAKTRNLADGAARPAYCQLTFDERPAESFVLCLAGSDDAKFWDFLHVPETQAASAASVLLCRTEGLFCTTPEFLELFAAKEANANGVCPVSLCDSSVVRIKVTPVVALGFSLGKGILTGPLDLFDNPVFDGARRRASDL